MTYSQVALRPATLSVLYFRMFIKIFRKSKQFLFIQCPVNTSGSLDREVVPPQGQDPMFALVEPHSVLFHLPLSWYLNNTDLTSFFQRLLAGEELAKS